MAVDKLVDSTQLDADLTTVANAIRTKGGTSGSLAFPAGFAAAIAAIPSGEYTVSELFSDKTIPAGKVSITSDMTIISHQYMLYGRTGITEVDLPIATQASAYFAAECTALKTLNAPILKTAHQYSFDKCGFVYLVLPAFVSNSMFAFAHNTSLLAVDFSAKVALYNQCFLNDSNMSIMILRSTEAGELKATNVFNGTPFASGNSGGTLYVPQSLLASYQAATNWSTILGYTNNQILPIEGSIYEMQYADGTPIT